MNDESYMRRAIELAKKGIGWTDPNPMVGAVIVKDGRIIGEGYHKKCGELHAERNAIASLTESAEGGTIYVTLEPCNHYGKTPPCTDAIIENKIAKVVIGSRDPNPLVSGAGAKRLRENGIEVVEDFLRDECDALNPVFFHYITTGMPYVVMKYAMSIDGKIACYTGESKWITGEAARSHVHSLRGRYAAIMAGIGTVLADDPMLNCRIDGAHQPVRVIVDSTLRIPLESNIIKTAGEYRTIIACAVCDERKKADIERSGAEVICIPEVTEEEPSGSTKVDLYRLIKHLGGQKLDSCLVEGGGILHEAMLESGLVNHVCAYIAPKVLGGKDAKTPVEGRGASKPGLGALLENGKITQFGEDILLEYDVKEGMNGVYRNR